MTQRGFPLPLGRGSDTGIDEYINACYALTLPHRKGDWVPSLSRARKSAGEGNPNPLF